MKYNEEQLKIINSTEEKMAVIACAGSGKSTSIIGCVEQYIKEKPEDKVVVITFTVAAAAELKRRMSYNPNIEVSTIHSWCLRQLERLSARYDFRLRIMDEVRIKEILKELVDAAGFKYINVDILYIYVAGNFNLDITDRMRIQFDKIYNRYIKYKRDNNLFDFTDLPIYLDMKLKEYKEIIVDVDALFVDEFQDIDPTQLDIFNSTKTKKKVFIGDPKQSIYKFRGSIDDVSTMVEDYAEYTLTTNYRSKQEIVDYAETCNFLYSLNRKHGKSSDMLITGKILNSNIKCIRGDGGDVYYNTSLSSVTNLRTGTATSVAQMIMKYANRQDAMILCRYNKQVKKLKELGVTNACTIHKAKGLEYDTVVLLSFDINTIEDINIAYVGMTRAKNTLVVCGANNFINGITKVDKELLKRNSVEHLKTLF